VIPWNRYLHREGNVPAVILGGIRKSLRAPTLYLTRARSHLETTDKGVVEEETEGPEATDRVMSDSGMIVRVERGRREWTGPKRPQRMSLLHVRKILHVRKLQGVSEMWTLIRLHKKMIQSVILLKVESRGSLPLKAKTLLIELLLSVKCRRRHRSALMAPIKVLRKSRVRTAKKFRRSLPQLRLQSPFLKRQSLLGKRLHPSPPVTDSILTIG
jgi:hypothetical protein